MMFDISQSENKSQNPDGSNNLNIQKPQTRASRHFENNSVINYNKDMNQELGKFCGLSLSRLLLKITND